MKQVCDYCGNSYDSSRYIVWEDGPVCEGCSIAYPGNPVSFRLDLSWDTALLLESLLDGDINLEILKFREKLRDQVANTMLVIVRKATERDESKAIQEPDP